MDESAPQPVTINRLLNVYPSFALLAGLQLDVFTLLSAGPLSAAQLSASLRVDSRRLRPLLHALASCGLLRVEGEDYFANAPEAQLFLARGAPSYIGEVHLLCTRLWEAALRTAASIRMGRPQACHDFASMPAAELEAFLRGLHPDALATGQELAAREEFAACGALLDVGGGSGGVSIALARVHPNLRATVAELPAVVPLTRRFVEEAGLADRIRVQAVNIISQPMEGRFDAAVLKAFLQVLSPAQIQQTLSQVAAALRPGGRVYVLGQGILDDSRLSPPEAAAFNIVFLNLYEEGQAHTESEYRAWLEAAGFKAVERTALRDGSPMIVAQKI